MEILQQGATELGLSLSHTQIEGFETLYRELISWNQKVNLTTITEYPEVQVKHFLDSLTSMPLLRLNSHTRLLDLGSGAGMPGLPIKIAYPQLQVGLIESVAKKTAFIHHVVARLGLEGIEVLTGRAEEIAHDLAYREQFNVVLCRAVARLPVALELGLPFCIQGGLFITYKQGDIAKEMHQSEKALALLGGRFREVIKVGLKGLEKRCLVVTEKVALTPSRYPRRPGIPAKRPLI